ncbi:hypothetical protein Tco_0315135, partial [Tanacetum coccineum]
HIFKSSSSLVRPEIQPAVLSLYQQLADSSFGLLSFIFFRSNSHKRGGEDVSLDVVVLMEELMLQVEMVLEQHLVEVDLHQWLA